MVKNLLVIDDDNITGLLIKLSVTKHRFADQVTTLTNGKEGIMYFEKLVSHGEGPAPDLIFLDLTMPVMDGWDFLEDYSRRFEFLFPQTSICLLSAAVFPQQQRRASAYSSIVAFLSKPIRISEIEVLKKHESLKHHFAMPATVDYAVPSSIDYSSQSPAPARLAAY